MLNLCEFFINIRLKNCKITISGGKQRGWFSSQATIVTWIFEMNIICIIGVYAMHWKIIYKTNLNIVILAIHNKYEGIFQGVIHVYFIYLSI